MNFPEQLSSIRKQRGITQKEVAEAIKITTRNYQRYEAGVTDPTLSVATSLADYFDVSLDYLVGRSDVPERR